MPLFYVTFEDAASLVIDAADEGAARAAALVEEENDAPITIAAVQPGTFAARVNFEPDKRDPKFEMVELVPAEITGILLAKLEDEGTPDEDEDEDDDAQPPYVWEGKEDPTPAETMPPCGYEGETANGDVFACELEAGHAPPHKAGSGRTWFDAE